MVFPIAGGNESKGYDVENSLRFNDDDSPRLTKTFSSEGDKRTNTFSCWVKRCNLTQSFIVAARHTSTGSDSHLKFDSSHRLAVKLRYQDSNDLLVTNRVFRDVSAWYHIVFMVDSTQATVSNRVKLYVNGVEETSFATDNRSNLGQNNTEAFGDDVEHAVAGRAESSTSEYSDLYIAETHFVNGSNLDATSFGEFDDNGVWIPKKYTGSYGTNGFFLQFKQTGTSANSSGIGADTSGNDNHFTPTNLAATDITEDTCTNNFATMNPIGTNNIATHSEGNTKLTTGGGASISGATIAMTAGKWYAEFTCTAKTSVNMNVGIVRADSFDGDNQMDEGNNVGYAFQNTGDIYHGGANESYGASWAVDDVIGIAFNADNLNVEFFKNGVGQGNYTRITSENSGGDWIMCVGEGQASGTTATFECNFGNPPSSVSSGNTDGKYGNFEYAPPSGYYALCTKRLAEFG